MTHRATGPRTLHVDALARVEGEGALHIEIADGRLRDAQLQIYEPPRFFEAFLRGRRYSEPPDITARICGICPVAYQMSACAAIEAACGVTVDGPIADLRRLLYCAEWIESHALHVHLLHAPDFLGYESAIAMAADHRGALERGLDLKKAGNQLLELVGGRAIHPVNVRVGGFYRAPTRRELLTFAPRLEQARDEALATVRWVAGFDFPDQAGDWELVALRRPGEYPITRGRLVSTGGLDIGPDEFGDEVVEEHLERSTALHGRLRGHGRHLVGPLARFALNADELAPLARAAAAEAGLVPGTRNPFRTIVVRAVETLHACEDALAIVEGYEEPDSPAVLVEPRPGVGTGWTEAPRGLLWHRYEIDGDGVIVDARIVPPTAQNQAAIEHDVFRYVDEHLDLSDEELAHGAERAIRNHDPCISCATHFLDVRVERT
jgi:sulfhydrogenase subunit alpha